MKKLQDEQYLEERIRSLVTPEIPYTVKRKDVQITYDLYLDRKLLLKNAFSETIVDWCAKNAERRTSGRLSRVNLIAICEKAATVDINKWSESAIEAQTQLGECWVLLKSNCVFKILKVSKELIELEFNLPGNTRKLFYLPTVTKLSLTKTWWRM